MKGLFVLLAALFGIAFASKCQKERKEATSSGLIGIFIPSCAADGSYSAMQCHDSTGMCYCARKDGSKINEEAIGKYLSCNCIRKAADATDKELIGTFVPECQENGKYSKQQCWPSIGKCWCVDENTGKKLSKPKPGPAECH